MKTDARFGKDKSKSIIGKRFGRLTVISRVQNPPPSKYPDAVWLCRCDCGKETSVRTKHIGRNTFSCGCLQRERAAESAKKSVRHGHSRVGKVRREYNIWAKIIARCCNRHDAGYHDYGGRGISICDEWRNSFEAFVAYVGPRPSNEYSIDRYPNNDGNYEPGNVRWATAQEQSRNRRDRVPITFNGRTMLLVDWAAETGISIHTIHSRIRYLGWSIERALTTNPRLYHHRS